MAYADRVKESSTTTGTGAIALAGAATGFRTFAAGFTVGATMPYAISDASGNWEIGVGTLSASTTLARTTVLASSNAGALVNFPAGSKDVFCTLTAAQIAAFQVSQDIAFSSAVPLTVAGTQYMPAQTVSSVIAFSVASSPVKGASVYVRLTADGTNAPTFTGMKEWGGSLGYDNRAGIANQVQFFHDGVDTFYSISQAVGAVAVDNAAPTASSAAVANATPTVVALALSEPMDTAYVPAASAFTVGGHTVSSVAFATSTVLNITVSAAFVNGEAAHSLAYTQPGANNLRDAAGNLLASFSGLAITNNVASAATYLRLSQLSFVTESGTGPYTYSVDSNASGNYSNNGGISTLSRPVSGDVTVGIINTNDLNLLFGTVATNATTPIFTGMSYGIWTTDTAGGNYQTVIGGSPGGTVNGTATARAAGDVLRFRQVGTNLLFEVARTATPTTFILVHTFASVPTTAYKFAVNMHSTVGKGITTTLQTGLA